MTNLTNERPGAARGFAPPDRLSLADWLTEMRALLSVSLPLVGGMLAQIGMGATDTLLIGRLGATPLASAVLGQQLFFVMFLIGLGMAYAVMPLAATAVGRGEPAGVRRSVRMGLWAVILFALLSTPVFVMAESLFLAMRQDPEVARAGAGYARILQVSLLPALIIQVLRNYLSALDRGRPFVIAMTAGLVLNLPLAYALIFGAWGAPALGLNGAAIATGIVNLGILVLLATVAARDEALRQYQLFRRFWRPDWPALLEVFRLGWPISLSLLAEVTLFAGSSILMGWVGVVPLAAHGIALQVISILFMIPLGLSGGATVRIGLAMGRNDQRGVRVAGLATLALTLGLALASATLCLTLPGPLIGLFLDRSREDAQAILDYGVPLMAVAAAFQVFDWLQVVSAGLLRGLKDTRVPMAVAVLCYSLVGVPAAYIIAFQIGVGGTGVWMGMALGLALAGPALTWRFMARERLGLIPVAAPGAASLEAG